MNSSADANLISLGATDTKDQCASFAQLVEIGDEWLQQVAGGQGGLAQSDPR